MFSPRYHLTTYIYVYKSLQNGYSVTWYFKLYDETCQRPGSTGTDKIFVTNMLHFHEFLFCIMVIVLNLYAVCWDRENWFSFSFYRFLFFLISRLTQVHAKLLRIVICFWLYTCYHSPPYWLHLHQTFYPHPLVTMVFSPKF